MKQTNETPTRERQSNGGRMSNLRNVLTRICDDNEQRAGHGAEINWALVHEARRLLQTAMNRCENCNQFIGEGGVECEDATLCTDCFGELFGAAGRDAEAV